MIEFFLCFVLFCFVFSGECVLFRVCACYMLRFLRGIHFLTFLLDPASSIVPKTPEKNLISQLSSLLFLLFPCLEQNKNDRKEQRTKNKESTVWMIID
jgi:hypothetical protein